MIIKSLDHLQLISKKIADNISVNDCIFLIGEIGTGKTTFTRYLINYFQKREGVEQTQVLSPTFNLLYEYSIKKITIMHYDLYRIKSKKEVDQLGILSENKDSIKIIEWPKLMEMNVTDRLELHINYSNNENERDLILKGKGKWMGYKLNEL
ncbi:MAG: tRNA (adenosine(37)-N6)-threonylcarbamoyltransferase complex ATPase subunit type 1 TsaE [Pelagibacteraceae bacterium]